MILEEPDGDALPAEHTPLDKLSSTFIVKHQPNAQQQPPTQLQAQSPTSPAVPSFCPHCFQPYIQANIYFQMLQQLANSSFTKMYFTELGPIGSGSFGSVVKVQHHIQDVLLSVYALKRIPIGTTKPWLLRALKEVTILQQLQHRNIVRYHHCWLESIRAAVNVEEPQPHLCILLDYAKGGSLYNLHWKKLGRALRCQEFLYLLQQAAAGLSHLHQTGFLSRDVKPQNFLITGDVEDRPPTEYVDSVFGEPNVHSIEYFAQRKLFKTDQTLQNSSRQLQFIRECGVSNLHVLLTDFGQQGDDADAGTELFEAPEVPVDRKHSQQSDVYSLALSFLSLVVEQEPIEDSQLYQQNAVAQFAELREFAPAANIIDQMLQPDPAKRPSAAEIADSCAHLLKRVPVENMIELIRPPSPSALLECPAGAAPVRKAAETPARSERERRGRPCYLEAVCTLTLALVLCLVLRK